MQFPSRRIRRKEKLKLPLRRISGPITTCQAQPAFEAHVSCFWSNQFIKMQFLPRRIRRREKLKLLLKRVHIHIYLLGANVFGNKYLWVSVEKHWCYGVIFHFGIIIHQGPPLTHSVLFVVHKKDPQELYRGFRRM